ncbi:hypothetical protein FOA52_002959 [Chlamydomonas sp. UWO 241]|nr:hypothetical protein FOA52_002959 [Chlamydomonas sp. UWO 241]
MGTGANNMPAGNNLYAGNGGTTGWVPVPPAGGAAMVAPQRCCGVRVRVWVWCVFWFAAVFGFIFSVLCAMSYQGMMDAVDDVERVYAPAPGTPIDAQLDAWRATLRGAQLAAAFAFVLMIVFAASTLFMLMASFKSLGNPGRRFGRAFLIAAASWTALHLLHITLQMQSYHPVMSALGAATGGAPFNFDMLRACVAFGYMSALLYLVFAVLVLLWNEKPSPSEQSAEMARQGGSA